MKRATYRAPVWRSPGDTYPIYDPHWLFVLARRTAATVGVIFAAEVLFFLGFVAGGGLS